MLSFILAHLLTSEPTVTRDIVYNKAGEVEVVCDFTEAVSESKKPKPLVVIIHGGAWIQGSKKEMDPLAVILAQNGFSSANINYRLAPKNKWPSMLDDCQAAVRFFRLNAKKYNIDPVRIGAMGASAGGHLSLLLGMSDDLKKEPYIGNSSRVQVVVNLFGPTDLSADFNPALAQLVAIQVLGKKLDDADKEIHDFSPINHIDKSSVPVFTIHGKADPLVPVKQAERLDAALKNAGIPHETIYIDDMKHEFPVEKPAVKDALMKSIDFLKKYLMK